MNLEGNVCVVTGATSGVGRALALALVRRGAHVWAIGRNRERIESLASEAAAEMGGLRPITVDLEHTDGLESVSREILSRGEAVNLLMHSAGTISRGLVESAPAEELDRQYRVNLRAPFVLTRALLPALKRSRGQIVFVNSSVGAVVASPDAAAYAATKHGLRALADSLRQEVNAEGIRVLTVYLGRTATPMQEQVHDHEGRIYRPQFLMRPEDVAEVVLSVAAGESTVEVTDISLRPLAKLPEAGE